MPPVIVRDARTGDTPQLAELDSLLPGFAEDLRPLFTGQRDDYLNMIATHGSQMGLHLLVAEAEGETVGYAFTSPRSVGDGIVDASSSVLVVQRLVVAESMRSRGVGSRLLAEIDRRTRSQARSMLHAHVPESAADFYESQGWDVLTPAQAIAWIETPSVAVWEALRASGADAGSRRRMTLIRAEDARADGATGYDRLAIRQVRPELISESFIFDHRNSPSSLMLAAEILANEIQRDPRRRRTLPPDVTRFLFDMILIPRLGEQAANRLRRG